jgi:hypothetical protein
MALTRRATISSIAALSSVSTYRAAPAPQYRTLLWAKPLFREPPCHSLLLTHGAHFFIQDEE